MKARALNTKFDLQNSPLIKKNQITPSIFTKNIKKGSILVALNKLKNYLGKKQEFISFSKEWKYSLYFYNSNHIIKNLPSDSINLNKLIKSYFSSYISHLTSSDKYRSDKIVKRSLNKIHVSRFDVKHTNSKAIFTIYTYNREKLALLRNKKGNNFINAIKKLGKFINLNYYLLNKLVATNKFKSEISKIIQFFFIDQILLIRRYKFRLNYNQYKFKKIFLDKLASFIKKIYTKEIEFNLVNLKSITFNTDIFTRLAVLKSKKKYAKIYKIMFYVLNIAKIPKINKIYEKSRRMKSVNLHLLENQFLNYNLNSIIKGQALKLNLQANFLHLRDSLSSIKKLSQIIFTSINFKKIGGIKLSIKGRLTKRYRADRAVFRLKWRGGLRNLDSSYKGLSVARKRGFLNPSVESSFLASRRRVGSFAVKGWTSSK